MSRIGRVGLIGLIVAIAAAISASAAMATTVTPASEGFKATIAPGSQFTFQTGIGETTCESITALGSVPASPGNVNSSGPVTAPLEGELEEAPEIEGCEAEVFGVGAGSADAITSGEWTVEVEDPNVVNSEGPSPVARIVVPVEGLVMEAHVFGADCVARGRGEEGEALEGEWVNGSGGAPSMIHVVNQELPVSVSGAFFCEEEKGTAVVNGDLSVEGTGGEIITVTE